MPKTQYALMYYDHINGKTGEPEDGKLLAKRYNTLESAIDAAMQVTQFDVDDLKLNGNVNATCLMDFKHVRYIAAADEDDERTACQIVKTGR